MAQEEAEVERRVAGVGALEVEQDQPAGVDQDVLGAEVAQDERPLAPGHVHRGDQRVDPRGEVGMGPRDRAVVGVDPQLVEEGRVGEDPAQSVGCPGASAWIVPRIVPSLRGDLRVDLARPSAATSRSPSRPGRRSSRTGNSGDPRRAPRGRCRAAGSSASRSSAARSAQMRSSRARHSMATRSRSRHCLITKGARPATSTRRTTFETPPVSSRTSNRRVIRDASRLAEVVGGVVRMSVPA